jgi:hypothetical protein
MYFFSLCIAQELLLDEIRWERHNGVREIYGARRVVMMQVLSKFTITAGAISSSQKRLLLWCLTRATKCRFIWHDEPREESCTYARTPAGWDEATPQNGTQPGL